MSTEYVLSVNQGTTNCKTVLIDPECTVREKAVRELPVAVPQPGWAEQDPELWWSAVR